MRRRSLVGGTMAVLVGLMVACDEPRSQLPTAPSQFGIAGVEIIGPDTLAPGQSMQFAARVRMSDGTVKAVLSDPGLRWQVGTFPTLLDVSGAGVVTARQVRGETTVIAEFTLEGAVRRSTKEIVVVADGTYRVVGMVSDAEPPTSPVPGARVEVPGTSLVATTDASGHYRLYGVPAEASILVTANGYLPSDHSLHLTSHSTQNVRLALSGQRLVLTGPYTFAIDVGTGCNALPAQLHHRSYDAFLTQTGTVLDVRLTEPRFAVDGAQQGNRFTGRAVGGSATFTLMSFSYYYYFGRFISFSYPSVAERLSDGTFLVLGGSVVTTGSASGLSGTMNGSVTHYSSRFPSVNSLLVDCSSPNHRFTLTPR